MLVAWNVGAERPEQLVVDVARPAAVWADEDDNRLIVGRPDSQHPVAAVEVATADVLDVRPSEPVTGGLAASVLDLTNDAECGVSSATAEYPDLLVGDVRQRDVDRRLAPCFRRSAISALRSAPSGTVLAAR